MPLPNLGQLPPPSSAHPGLYQRPHWGGSWHGTLACPQGSSPLPPAPVLTFPAWQAHPDLPRAQGQNLCLSSSSPHGLYPAPHPSPSVLHPCRRRPITKTLAGPQQEYRTDLRFGVMAAQPRVPDRTALGSLCPAPARRVHRSPGLPELDLSPQVPPCCNRELTGPPPGLIPRGRCMAPCPRLRP